MALLSAISIPLEVPGDTFIFKEYDQGDSMYLVIKGRAKVFIDMGGKENIIASIGDQDCFGEMAILDGLPRSASVKTIEPSLLLKIGKDNFNDLLENHSEVSFELLKILSKRLREKSK
ncbi:MAG: cyclic nucleotide-binding domain-containing protein [Armatimonadetes bacterium]|nr:cyclic nucleotide-binding domain-containing protein [Armatimonadota bacterium]